MEEPTEMKLTAEQLRSEIVKGIDAVTGARWIFRQHISAEQMRILKAQRAFWMSASSEVLNELLAYYNREPLRAQDEGTNDSTG